MSDARRARARLIATSTFEDPLVTTLTPRLQGILLWVAIIIHCDTAGRCDGDPKIIRHAWFSEFDDSEFNYDLIESLLQQMEQERPTGIEGENKYLIRRYTAGGKKKHLQINEESWSKHQKFRFTPSSEHPAPPTADERKETATESAPETTTKRTEPAQERRQGILAKPPDSDDLANALRSRINKELFGSKFNLYQIALKLYKDGMHDVDHIFAILKRVRENEHRIINVWGYIKSQGLISSAMSDVVELRAKAKPMVVISQDIKDVFGITPKKVTDE